MSALGHHWAAFRQAVTQERAAEGEIRRNLETAFLPAALEVIERPVSPTARRTTWVLFAFMAATLLWLVFGRVDVVASAEGKIVPSGAVKLVQAATAGTVRRIYVREGDVVRRGQPLVDLDPTVTTADEAQAGNALLAARVDVARNAAIVDGLSGGRGLFVAPAGTPAEVAETQRRLVAAQLAANGAESRGLAAARRAALSDADAARQQMRALDDTGPLLDRQLEAIDKLVAKGFASGFRLMELQRQRRSEAGNREVAAAQRMRGLAEAQRYAQQIAQSRDQARQIALGDLARAQNDETLRREELKKAAQRSRMQRLVAPVDGAVQQLGVHTIGGVVEPASPLMVVVPNGGLTVEARVLNRDAGLVRAGQRVAVKLEAFPFTRYGALGGRIVTISRDAIQDGKTAPYYIARIALDARTIRVDGQNLPLSPGLTATADIRIGSRRIGSYLLSPVQQSVQEAGREH